MHRTAFGGDCKAAFQRHDTTARLDEKQGLGRYRVIQFLGVFGIVTADAHHLTDGKVNPGTVDILVLIAHGPTPLITNDPVAAAAGCVRRRSRRKVGDYGLPGKPRIQDLRSLRNRTQPAAAATGYVWLIKPQKSCRGS